MRVEAISRYTHMRPARVFDKTINPEPGVRANVNEFPFSPPPSRRPFHSSGPTLKTSRPLVGGLPQCFQIPYAAVGTRAVNRS